MVLAISARRKELNQNRKNQGDDENAQHIQSHIAEFHLRQLVIIDKLP